MSKEFDFSWRTAKYHEALDNWGFAAGTRIWMADSDYKPVQEVEPGDKILGEAFQIEQEYIEKRPNAQDPTENLQDIYRPFLVEREVLEVRTVKARAWQLTFGDQEKEFKKRRLVAGAETPLRLFPLAHDVREAKPIANCYTAVENPRTGPDYRKAMREAKGRSGETEKLPTEFTGTKRGELAVIVPYLAFLGQVNVHGEDSREYPRYLHEQVREIIPLMDPETTLYQIFVQPDTTEDLGVVGDMGPRANVIVQTPFAPDNEQTTIRTNRTARQLDGLGKGDVESFEQRWDEWAEKRGDVHDDPEVEPGSEETREVKPSGHYYETRDGEKGEALSKYYGLEDGFLDGGILMDLPLPPDYTSRDDSAALVKPSKKTSSSD